jgi:hypothetical protein
MIKRKLLYSKEVTLDDDKKIRLEYNMTESLDSGNEKPYYGIQIIKNLEDNFEMDEVRGISFSREKVEKVAKILFENIVTPISIVEIVDDLITLEVV